MGGAVRHFVVMEPKRRVQRREYGRRRGRGAEHELLSAPPSILADLPTELLAAIIVRRPVNPAPNARDPASFGGCCEGWIRQRHRLRQFAILDVQASHGL